MAKTAGDILVESLIDWGVEVIFGIPGDGVNGIIEALRKKKDRINFVQVRHEESAAFMACGYAKFTGKLGCCIATSGPGGIHLLNGLYDAKLDGQPVLAITGLQYHDLIGTYTQQDVQLDYVFQDVATYNSRIMGPAHVRNVVDLACRSALSYRTVSHITMPVDMQTMEVEERSERNVPHHTNEVFSFGTRLPDENDLKRAAMILNEGKKIAILAGRGALHAGEELEKMAEVLGAPVIKALLGKAAIPDDSPYTTGGLGLLGTRPSQEALESCDTLLIVGSTMPYIEFYPKPGQARAVQIDFDPLKIGLRYPVEVGLVGDSKVTLEMLLDLVEPKTDRSFLEEAQKGMEEWNELLEKQGTVDSTPMKPQVVAYELNKRLKDDAIIAADSGTIASWAARFLKIRGEQKFSLSGTLASMANGMPYAIAAQVAHPDRQCIAFVGDGGFSMLMAEFATCVKYKLPVKIVIIKNNALGMIKWEQIVFLGNPEYECDLHPIDFAAFARACGGAGFTITDPKECGDILDAALNTPGPVIIEAVVDPFEPPMPPKVTMKQAAHFAEALLRGEPNGQKIALTVIANNVRQMT